MKKKLIYYFYLTEDFSTNLANRINFECLRRYARIFDEASIFISTDSVKNTELIMEAERVFMSMPFNGNIGFKVVNNTVYRESMVFEEEVVDKLGKLDCLLFFAHAKGLTNFKTYPENKEGIEKWIVGSYYLSLEYVAEMESFIGPTTSYNLSAYGSFPILTKKKLGEADIKESWDNIFIGEIKHNWYFSGCFFWINTKSIYNYINTFSPTIPKMSNRYFGEKFLGNIMPFDGRAMGHNLRYMFPCNFYNKGIVDSSLNFILNEDELADFNRVFEEILKNVGE